MILNEIEEYTEDVELEKSELMIILCKHNYL